MVAIPQENVPWWHPASAAGARRITPSLAAPHAVGLIERAEELRQRHAERPRQPVDDVQRRRLLPALQVAQVSPVQPRPASAWALPVLTGSGYSGNKSATLTLRAFASRTTCSVEQFRTPRSMPLM